MTTNNENNKGDYIDRLGKIIKAEAEPVISSFNVDYTNPEYDVITAVFYNEFQYESMKDELVSNMFKAYPQLRKHHVNDETRTVTYEVNKDTSTPLVSLLADLNKAWKEFNKAKTTDSMFPLKLIMNMPPELVDKLPTDVQIKIARLKEFTK